MTSMYSLVFDEDLFDIFSPQLSTCGKMIPNLTCAHFVQTCRKKRTMFAGEVSSQVQPPFLLHWSDFFQILFCPKKSKTKI